MPKITNVAAKSVRGLTLFPGASTPAAPTTFYRQEGHQSSAFGVSAGTAKPVLGVELNQSTGRYAGVNCFEIKSVPHCDGTHTENVGHILKDIVPIAETVEGLENKLLRTAVITVKPTLCTTDNLHLHPHAEVGDYIITKEAIETALNALPKVFAKSINALVIRCDHDGFLSRPYNTFDNPPYFSTEAMTYLVDGFEDIGPAQDKPTSGKVRIKHLLTNLPSIDRQNDAGTLCCHTTFFGANPKRDGVLAQTPAGKAFKPLKRTNTEMVYVPEDKPDGSYFLRLNVPACDLDHSPSMPVLYDAEQTCLPFDMLQGTSDDATNLSMSPSS